MAKKAKAAKEPKAPKAAAGKTTDLTDEQEALLLVHHVSQYEKFLAAKKKSDADFKNACKTAKAEGITVADIKAHLELKTPEGEAAVEARIKRLLTIAKWQGLALGTQAELDFTDRRPAVDRAREEGRQAGYEGKPMKPPYANELPQYGAFVEGWQEGQKALFKFQKERDAREMDGEAGEAGAGVQTGGEPAGEADLGDQPPTSTAKH